MLEVGCRDYPDNCGECEALERSCPEGMEIEEWLRAVRLRHENNLSPFNLDTVAADILMRLFVGNCWHEDGRTRG